MAAVRKGYIATSLVAVVVLGFVTITISITLAEQARNLLKIRRIHNYYMVESAVDIAKSMIVGQLQGMRLYVELDDGIPISSSPICGGSPETDFAEVCAKIEEIVFQENSKASGFSVEILVQNKSPEELQLHVLDKSGALFDMDEYTIGELMPIEYGVIVKLSGVELHTDFIISGIEFHMLDTDENNHQMTIELPTAHMSLETVDFDYR